MNTLFILNDAPCGAERGYNGLRLAQALGRMTLRFVSFVA